MFRKILGYVIVALAIFTSSCNENISEEITNGELDYSRMEEVSLRGISTSSNGNISSAQSRASATSTPMEIGKTFRLYAFPKGVTAMDKLIATRTYTIKDAAGEPVMDLNQESLFLPIGDIDIFLVGPVKHDLNEGKIDNIGNPLPPNIITIAAPDGVSPHFGVDLVSSKTSLTVKIGANQFQATPLNHRMAQMEVVVRRPDDALYTDLDVTAISVMNQNLTGDFVFNDAGGEITPSGEGTETLSPVIRTIIPQKEFRGTMYVLPREKVQLRIGVFLTCKTIGTGVSVDRRMESGIMTQSLIAGQMNRFTTNPYLSDRLIFRLRLMPWDDVSMDDLDILSNDEMLFSYSGMDAPLMIGGKMCIPDRSGNGNHGEIVGDIRYNADEHYYYAASQGAYVKVPDLGNVPVYTFEMTASSARNAKAVAASFTGNGADQTLSVNLPMDNNDIIFDAGNITTNRILSTNHKADIAWMDNMAVYAFMRSTNNYGTIQRNGVTLSTKSITPHNGLMTDNKLLWWKDINGNPQMLKMYASRMYSKVSNDAIKNNYRNDIMTFTGINVDKDPTKDSYIEEGLILDLRGTNGYTTVSGRNAWPDVSRSQNHAVVMSSTNPVYANNCYTFNGTSDYMLLSRTLGLLHNCTVEIVAKASPSSTILNFTNDKGGGLAREFQVHIDWGDEMQCNTPYSSSFGRNQIHLVKTMSTMAYSSSDQHSYPNQWSFKRKNGAGKTTLDALLNGYLEKDISVNEVPLLESRYCYIGSNGPAIPQLFGSSIYAIRVYNRPLSTIERQHNYQVDKIKYNLVP